jgi:hypothetical protein
MASERSRFRLRGHGNDAFPPEREAVPLRRNGKPFRSGGNQEAAIIRMAVPGLTWLAGYDVLTGRSFLRK